MGEIIHIAIDGPVASGKGTVAKLLSTRLGIAALDTGAMYRAVAVWMLERGTEMESEECIAVRMPEIKMKVEIKDDVTVVYIIGEDYTNKIRTAEAGKYASVVATNYAVREAMTKLQQEIAETNSFILEGRDISSVVLPNAKYKFYLTASVEKRAGIRRKELELKGETISEEEMVRQIKIRDARDSGREIAPLKIVEDAIIIDNSELTIKETIDKFCEFICV